MEAIIQRAIATSNDKNLSQVIRHINSFIISHVKGIMSRNQIQGTFDVTVRNKLTYSPDKGFSHQVTSVIKRDNDEREFINHHSEIISERNPLFLLRGIMMAQSLKVNMQMLDRSLVDGIRAESSRVINAYISETMNDTNAIVSIDRDGTGKHVIEIELVEVPSASTARYAARTATTGMSKLLNAL